jgi:NTE family protein
MRGVIGDIDLSELRIPVAVMATDLVTGHGVTLTEGPAAVAVQASSSIPEIFAPVRLGPHLLVDGGLTDYMPTNVVREMGADVVVGVNVVATVEFDDVPRHLMQLILRVIGLVAMNNARRSEDFADFVIRPDVGSLSSLALDEADAFIVKGREATLPLVPAIREALDPPFYRRLLDRWHRRRCG